MRSVLGLMLALSLGACASAPDLEALREEIRELHAASIQAHLDKDVDFLVEQHAPDYRSVGRGQIRAVDLAQIRRNFTSYLENTEFHEYRDLIEPVVGISRDGSQAWTLVKVKVVATRTEPDGSTRPIDFVCAWQTIFERRGGRWMRVTDVSTFEEGS